VLLAALVLAAIAARVLKKAEEEQSVVVKAAPAFNLRYGGTLERVDPAAGQVLALQSRVDGKVDQTFTVTRLTLPAYRGMPDGELPVVAEALKARLARRFADFTLVEEGRARINKQPGYEVVFAAHNAEGRRVYGRWDMVLPNEPGAREGVTLELTARWSSRVPNAGSLGDQGQLKLPLRSFRFGTEAP
jgi:hypothetical protein